ncbi:hypothetical protein FB451DRAFT_1211791 [Mycena latifolia]|nr:hypothetical protein FB451DRAFT_1211791 [Mycena latifolia]
MASENSPPSPPSRSGNSRRRRPTDRAQQTRNAVAAKLKARKDKKAKTVRRRVLRDRQNESNLTVERPDDSSEIRELRAALIRTQGERDAAEAAATRAARAKRPPTRTIARPSNMSKVTIADIREHLELAGAENDQAWSDLRTSIRRFMDAGMLDKNSGWKDQDSRRLLKIYDAVEAEYPNLERFRGQWATAFLVHESFGAQKTYKSCKSKDGTYRTRSRGHRLEASRLRRIEGDGFGGTGPRAPTLSPSGTPAPEELNGVSTLHTPVLPKSSSSSVH